MIIDVMNLSLSSSSSFSIWFSCSWHLVIYTTSISTTTRVYYEVYIYRCCIRWQNWVELIVVVHIFFVFSFECTHIWKIDWLIYLNCRWKVIVLASNRALNQWDTKKNKQIFRDHFHQTYDSAICSVSFNSIWFI